MKVEYIFVFSKVAQFALINRKICRPKNDILEHRQANVSIRKSWRQIWVKKTILLIR